MIPGPTIIISHPISKVRPNTNIALLEKKFPAFVNRYAGKELKEAGLGVDMYLQPISTIHTDTRNGKSWHWKTC